MKAYLDYLQYVLDNGVLTKNRTGIDTIACSGYMLQHDMKDGFPLLTTKKMGIKNIASELEMFIKGINSKKFLQDRGNKIWNEWCNPQKVPYSTDPDIQKQMAAEDDLGPIYGYNWINFEGNREIVKVPKKLYKSDIKVDIQKVYSIQSFENLDSYLKNLREEDTKRIFEVLDTYGVSIVEKLFKLWQNLFKQELPICEDWYEFSIFITDCTKLINFPKFLRDNTWVLSPDYYGAGVYSPETCVWVSLADFKVYRTEKPFVLKNHSTGSYKLYISKYDALKEYDLSNMSDIRKINNTTIELPESFRFDTSNFVYRYRLPENQLRNVIETIKKDPTSRRLIVSAWNPTQLNEMALPPCHLGFELLCYPETKTMDLIWAQRSCDSGLGVPYDLASYALLLTLICKETGYTPGKIFGMLGSCHIYVNQIDALKEQLKRTPHKLPTIEISNWTSIWDWKYSDVELCNYECEGKITMNIAV